MTSIELLRSALHERRPCALWLGQDAWAVPQGRDSVLLLLLERLGRSLPAEASWADVLAGELSPSDYEWLTERFERNVAREEISNALGLPWSAVFTSSIDPELLRRMETNGRQPEALISNDHVPAFPRSMTRPPVYFLFGRSSDFADSARCPPRKTADLVRRRTVAITLLGRLPETVSELGLLVIDGYAPERDWLDAASLFGSIPAGTGMRVLWCGMSEPPQDQLVRELIDDGTLILEPRRLALLVAELSATGTLPELARATRHQAGVISFGGDNFMEVSPSLRLRVEASTAIVDDEWTEPPRMLSRAAEEDAFVQFHGELGGARQLVEGIERGFAVERAFEIELRQRIAALIERRGDLDRLVLVHGQSGTGKSLAMARTALTFRTEQRVPVLFATGRIPSRGDVEAFSEAAERHGAPATLLLCDANASPHLYGQLWDSLQSKGRRVVLVGTSYRLDAQKLRSVDLILAPDAVSVDEQRALAKLVERYAPLGATEVRLLASGASDRVFAFLYRVLTASRGRLTSGVANEARAAEAELRQRAPSVESPRFASQLAMELVHAGFRTSTSLPLFEDSSDAVFGNDSVGRFIDYVMAAGRLDVYVPVNLLIRVLRSHAGLAFEQIATIFRDIDLFRWRPDEQGNELSIGPRLRLEAELICRRRLADPSREIACLVDLILGVRPRGLDRSAELTFLLDLLRNVDEHGPRASAYQSGYLAIAEALTRLRKEQSLEHASVMLQESNFRRAWLRATQHETDQIADQRDRVLDDARAVVDEALRRCRGDARWASPRVRQDLFVERAAVYGFAAIGHARRNAPREELWSDYEAAREASRQAMRATSSYYPFDVALWLPLDILDHGQDLLPEQRAEIVADIYSVLDRVDPDALAVDQSSQFFTKKDRVARTLRNWRLLAETHAVLQKQDPALALFLEARSTAKEALETSELPLRRELRTSCGEAVALLEQHWKIVAPDERCLRLLLELTWLSANGERLLRRDRRPIPTDAAVRASLLRTLAETSSRQGDAIDSRLRYLDAVLTWVSGDYVRAKELFGSLGRDTEFEDRRRPRRQLVLADETGAPLLHRGRLVREKTPGHWLIDVERRTQIALIGRDFPNKTLAVGRELRDFAIAFNFLGPIADPVTRPERPQ